MIDKMLQPKATGSSSRDETARGDKLPSLLAVDVDRHYGLFAQAYQHEVHALIQQLLNATNLEEVGKADGLTTAIFLQMYDYLKNLAPEDILKLNLRARLYRFTVDRCFGQLVSEYEAQMSNAVQQLSDKDSLEQSAAVTALAEEIFTSIRQRLSHCDQQAIRTPQFWLWLHNCVIAYCFIQLFETYRPQLETFVLQLSNHTADAEDIVQQALLDVFKNLKAQGVPSKGPFDPKRWIFTVAKNAFLKSLRKSNETGRDLSIDSVTEEHPVFDIVDDGNIPPDEVVVIAESQRNLAELVSKLREPFREIIWLRFFDDLSTEEVAARLSMKPGTVRSYIHRGIRLLRWAYEDKGL